jgi:hypothetical protein
MTSLATACAIVDELVDSGSFLRTQVSACDFGIMDTAPACAVTVRPAVSTFNTLAGYGHVSIDTWGYSVRGWVKDTGNVVQTLANVYHMQDALRGALTGGSIANCASLSTRVTSMTHNQENFYDFGGNDYLLVDAAVQATEDP